MDRSITQQLLVYPVTERNYGTASYADNAGGFLLAREAMRFYWDAYPASDVVVFNPDTVMANSTFDDPKQYPDGISHVIVNGTLVVDSGAHTGALPGRALRSQ